MAYHPLRTYHSMAYRIAWRKGGGEGILRLGVDNRPYDDTTEAVPNANILAELRWLAVARRTPIKGALDPPGDSDPACWRRRG